jgi:hypothetical protein
MLRLEYIFDKYIEMPSSQPNNILEDAGPQQHIKAHIDKGEVPTYILPKYLLFTRMPKKKVMISKGLLLHQI